MNKISYYTVEKGATFDPETNPTVTINGRIDSELNNATITTSEVNAGEEVLLSTLSIDVPENANTFIKWTGTDKCLGLFLNSQGELLENHIAYLETPLEDWIEVELIETEEE